MICVNGSVLAIRSGMMKAMGVLLLPSASSILGKGLRSRQRIVRSSTPTSSCWIARIIWPIGSRALQRVRLATTSLASTGSRSWNVRPGRSRNVQVRPSGDTSSASTIWRRGFRSLSMP